MHLYQNHVMQSFNQVLHTEEYGYDHILCVVFLLFMEISSRVVRKKLMNQAFLRFDLTVILIINIKFSCVMFQPLFFFFF